VADLVRFGGSIVADVAFNPWKASSSENELCVMKRPTELNQALPSGRWMSFPPTPEVAFFAQALAAMLGNSVPAAFATLT
jgi:hypothetical protein